MGQYKDIRDSKLVRKNVDNTPVEVDPFIAKKRKQFKEGFMHNFKSEPTRSDWEGFENAMRKNPKITASDYLSEKLRNGQPMVTGDQINSDNTSTVATNTTTSTGYSYPGNATPAQTPMQKALGTNEMSKDTKESVTEENTYSEPKMHVIRNSVDPVYIPTETAARGGWEKLFFGAEGPAAEVHKTNVINAQLYEQYAQMNSPQVQMEQPRLMSRKASTISNALSQQQKAIDDENKFKPVSEPTISGVTRNGQAAITHSVSYNNLNEPLLFLEPQKIDFSPEEWERLKAETSFDDAYGQQLKLAMSNLVDISEDKEKGTASLKITQGRLIPDQKWLDYFNNFVVKANEIPQIAKGATPGTNPLTGAVKSANDSITK